MTFMRVWRRTHSRAAALVGSFGVALAGCATHAPTGVATAAAGPTCSDLSFPIYFAKGSDVLSEPARQAIVADAAGVKGCRVSEVDVFGLADADGPTAPNLELSRRRAQTVAQALMASGFPQPLFDVKALGESTARTAQGRPALLQRKTVVVIHVAKTG